MTVEPGVVNTRPAVSDDLLVVDTPVGKLEESEESTEVPPESLGLVEGQIDRLSTEFALCVGCCLVTLYFERRGVVDALVLLETLVGTAGLGRIDTDDTDSVDRLVLVVELDIDSITVGHIDNVYGVGLADVQFQTQSLAVVEQRLEILEIEISGPEVEVAICNLVVVEPEARVQCRRDLVVVVRLIEVSEVGLVVQEHHATVVHERRQCVQFTLRERFRRRRDHHRVSGAEICDEICRALVGVPVVLGVRSERLDAVTIEELTVSLVVEDCPRPAEQPIVEVQ